MTREVRTPTQV